MERMRISAETEWVRELLDEASFLASRVGDVAPELLERLLGFAQCPGEIVSIDADRSAATATSEYRVRLKVSDGFLVLVLALRARHRELDVAIQHVSAASV